jgi:hypothetical protein
MKANEKKWFWVLVFILAIVTPIMTHYFKYGYYISLLIIIIALNSTNELRQDFKKNYWNKFRNFNIICLAIILVYLILEILFF